MNSAISFLVLLMLCSLAFRPIRRVLMLLFLRTAGRKVLEDVGQKAMAKQADSIHLTPKPDHQWANRPALVTLAAPLPSLGFAEAGTYGINEMAGVFVRFFVQPQERIAACIYEHPKAGTWIDFFAHFPDGTRITCTSKPATGLGPQPGAPTIHAPDLPSDEMYRRLLREMPPGERIEFTPENVVERFERVYAESMAWRKRKGISAGEVARHIQVRPSELGTASNRPG